MVTAPQNHDLLRLIAQGVINALFAKRRIRCVLVVRKVVENDSYRFRLYLKNMSAIEVLVDPEEFFSEAVRKEVLRRFAAIRQSPRLHKQ